MRSVLWTMLVLLAVPGLARAQPAAPVGDLPVPPHVLPTQPLTSATADPTLSGSAAADAGQGKAGAADNGTQPAPRHAREVHARTTGRNTTARTATDPRPPH